MVYSPGRMFNTPPNVRMSPGKPRKFQEHSAGAMYSRLDRIFALQKEYKRRHTALIKEQKEVAQLNKVLTRLIRNAISYANQRPSMSLYEGGLHPANRNRLLQYVRYIKEGMKAVRTLKRLPLNNNTRNKIAQTVVHG